MLEQVPQDGVEALPQLLRIVINGAMQADRPHLHSST
jgi:hypothetical protein